MNFLTKTLNSLTGQLIPYNKGDFVLKIEGFWDLYDGTSKNDGSNVTIFQFEKQQLSSHNYRFALNNAKKLSLIKYPGVLRVIEVIDNDSALYMVTERVKPLSYSSDSDESKILGVYNVAKTLRFLNQDASSVHGKVNIESVFVTEGGEWKLGGFEILTNLNDPDKLSLLQGHSLHSFNMYVNPPELTSLEVLTRGKSGLKFDSFKLGCLILQVYSPTKSSPVDLESLLSMVKNVPRSLQLAVKKLLSDSITTRASSDLFLRKGEESFFDIDYIRYYKDLQEIDLKSNVEKLEIFENLTSNVKNYPTGFVEFSLLPLMINFFHSTDEQLSQPQQQQQQVAQQGNETPPDIMSKVLLFILNLSDILQLEQPKFNKLLKPVIFQSFAKNDRAIRMTLLTSLPQYISRFEKSEINNNIFNHLTTGFADTNPAIREETLKSITVIAEYLTERQLNNDLLRYIAKLQNDESETIRTNVVIVLSKIGFSMNKNSRLNILITAFNKSIKDPFIPTRLSTIVAFGTCIEFFTPEIIASRILSIIAPSLLDKSVKIRQELSKIFAVLLEIINKELLKLPTDIDDDENEKDVSNLGKKLANTALGWGHLNRFATPPVQEENSQIKWSHSNGSASKLQDQVLSTTDDGWGQQGDDDFDDIVDDLDDGWGEEEEAEEEEVYTKPIVKPTPKPAPKPVRNTPVKTTTPLKTGRTSGGLKLQLKPKTSKLKLDLKLDEGEDNWGDGWD